MSPRTKEQFREIRESRKEQIMQAALELFAKEGYDHCSIASLAEYIGISKGLMYNYFPSKEELLAAIIDKGLQEIMDLFDPDHDGVITSEELEYFIRKTFKIMRSNQEFWILYISLLMQPKITEHLKDKPFIRRMENSFNMFLSYFESKGFKDPLLEVLTIMAMLEGLGVMLIYAYPVMTIPDDLLQKYEQRIIDMYK